MVASIYGRDGMFELATDVLSDLDPPRATILTEVPGPGSEASGTSVPPPLESVHIDPTGVQAVRSSSGVGLSVIYVEFGWGTNIYVARQIVAEKVALATDRLPQGANPQLAPISSIMGQIVLVGMWSETGKTDPIE